MNLLGSGVGRISFIVLYFILMCAMALYTWVMLRIAGNYYGELMLAGILIYYFCCAALCYLRGINIHPKLSIAAVIPLVGIFTNYNLIALLGFSTSTNYNLYYAPIAAMLYMLFVGLLAILPGGSLSVKT